MADIFEIKGVNAELQIGDKTFKFADPKFKDKVLLQKEMKELQSKKAKMPEDDYLIKQYELTGKMIKQYLPTLSDETLEEIGDFARMALLQQLTLMAEKNFGALVQKVEGK